MSKEAKIWATTREKLLINEAEVGDLANNKPLIYHEMQKSAHRLRREGERIYKQKNKPKHSNLRFQNNPSDLEQDTSETPSGTIISTNVLHRVYSHEENRKARFNLKTETMNKSIKGKLKTEELRTVEGKIKVKRHLIISFNGKTYKFKIPLNTGKDRKKDNFIIDTTSSKRFEETMPILMLNQLSKKGRRIIEIITNEIKDRELMGRVSGEDRPMIRISVVTALHLEKKDKLRKKLKKNIAEASRRKSDLKLKKDQVKKLKKNDVSREATRLREEAGMPYHGAKKISIPINEKHPETDDLKIRKIALQKKRLRNGSHNMRALIEESNRIGKTENELKKLASAIRKQLFIDFGGKGLYDAFAPGLFFNHGKALRELAYLLTKDGFDYQNGYDINKMKVFFQKRILKKRRHHTTMTQLVGENDYNEMGIHNIDLHMLFEGKNLNKEIPIARVCSEYGDILLEITISQPETTNTRVSDYKKGNIEWTGGQLNIYHRNRNINGARSRAITGQWLRIDEESLKLKEARERLQRLKTSMNRYTPLSIRPIIVNSLEAPVEKTG